MNQRNERNRNNNEEGGWNTAAIVGGVLGGLGLAAAGAGWLYTRGSGGKGASGNNNTEGQSASSRNPPQSTPANTERHQQDQRPIMSDYLASVMERMNTNSGGGGGSPSRRGVPRSSVPENPSITNLNSLLDDIYKRFIALNDEDFENYYSVMNNIFSQIHYKMKDVDPYYKKYSSTVQYAGSHPDRLRINKPDEFDVDIVIGLPLCYQTHSTNPDESDFTFEPKDPGFIQLKMGVQYDRLPYRDRCEWHINKAAYEWKDEKNYLLRSKFMDWFKSVVNRALNEFQVGNSDPIFYVQGVPYKIRKSESGPAMTLYVENNSRNFKLDVDLVPALRFPINRWPVCGGYRSVPPRCGGKDYWMVVPKPNKSGQNEHDKSRSWRVALHEQEGMLMHDTNHMRQAIRLIKKLRDAQDMNKIASYYIKTLFFWEAIERETEREFWNNNPAFLFKYMLKKFHQALVDGKISYFWNKNNNLIGHVPRNILNQYAKTVGELLDVLERPSDYKKVAKYLLTSAEFKQYEKYLKI